MAKMTLEKLAGNLNKLASDTDKKFDSLAVMIKRGFDGVDKRLNVIEGKVLSKR